MRRELRDVEVLTAPVLRRADGGRTFSNGLLGNRSISLGEADVVNVLKGYSGIDAMGDYGSGVVIDGSAPAQTIYRLAGVPVIFPYRFGGIFTTFNNAHFRTTLFERNIHSAAMPSRLGSLLDYTPHRQSSRLGAVVNAGILSSSATVRTPVGPRASVAASARVSYVNQLYGRLLKTRRTYIGYDFADFNLSADYSLGPPGNLLALDLMYSTDNLDFNDTGYAMDTAMKWHNRLAVLSWNRSDSLTSSNLRAYYSGFDNRLRIDMPLLTLGVDSRVSLAGVSGDIVRSTHRRFLEQFTCGFELQSYSYSPAGRHPLECRIFGDAHIPLSKRFSLRAGVSAMYYRNGSAYARLVADPRVTVTYSRAMHTLTLHAGRYAQTMHQVGFSDLGLAADFRLAADKKQPAQSATGLAAEYSCRLPFWNMTLGAGAYYKRITSEPEYEGLLVDLLSAEFNPADNVIDSRGYNAGINAEISVAEGPVAAQLSYGYGVARRKYGADNAYCRGVTSPGHSLKAAADWRIDDRWNVGVNFTLRSGRPYTPVDAIYVIAGNLIEMHGERNSSRLPAYHRADIRASYSFRTGGGDRRMFHRINLALINAYGHDNVEIQAFDIDARQGTYSLRRVSSLYRFLPSISYTLQL